MNNGNLPRPLTLRKQVQIMLALTILAWPTQTLVAKWSPGAEPAATFVPRDAQAMAGGTLELRAEASVHGGEVKLRQVCRWADSDAAMFAPVADVVLVKLEARRPFAVIDVRQVRQLLEEAGI